MMNKYLSLLLLISVLVIGVFGFTSMNHGADHAVGCIASVVDNTPCPENITEMSVHHIQAFVSFFSAVPSIPFIFLLALIFALFLCAGFLYLKRQNLLLSYPAYWQTRHDPERQLTRSRDITSWLSLFENSPNLHRASITISNLINLCKQKGTNTINIMIRPIQTWHSTLSAVWSLMQTLLRQVRSIKAKPITFALSTVRITLQPIQ